MATEVASQSNLSHRLDVVEGKVDKHDRFIEGIEADGKDSAKTRLTVLENGYTEIIKRLEKINALMTALLLTIVGGFVGWFLFTVLPKIIGHVGTP